MKLPLFLVLAVLVLSCATPWSPDAHSRSEWWRYELSARDPRAPSTGEVRTWRVRVAGETVRDVFEPGSE